MTSGEDSPENLCVRARRHALSAAEQDRLTEVLGTSASLRLAYRLGRDFDTAGAVQAGDEERVARFVAKAMKHRRASRVPTRHRRWSPWLIAAAVFGCCAVAMGLGSAFWPRPVALRSAPVAPAPNSTLPGSRGHSGQPYRSQPTTDSEQTEPGVARRATDRPVAVTGSSLAASGHVGEPPGVSTTGIPTANANVAVSAKLQPPPTGAFDEQPPAEPTASALLEQANAARSRGEIERASALLRALQSRFPASPEALLSHVSLGKLLLLRGNASAALEQFDVYLAARGPLAEEALLGRAQALGVLGRPNEERATWQALLDRFPRSVYAMQARDRLQSLTEER